MLEASYLIVSSIREKDEQIVGYRVVDMSNKNMMDISTNDLIQGIMYDSSKFVNVRLDYRGNLYFATYSKTSRELPSLTLSGRRLLGKDAYTIGYSDSRGNLICYNAHGERFIVQPNEYLSGIKTFTNGAVSNGNFVGNFITKRLDKDYFISRKLRVPPVYGSVMSV